MDKSAWAKNLSLDPMWQEVIADLRIIELGKFQNSSDEDFEVREGAYRQLKAIDSLVNHIEWMASTGKMDEKRLKFF